MNKFDSQICTTIEQSQRLLDLGFKPETADMYYFWLGGNDYCLKVDVDKNPLKYNMDKTYIPAWSLHRLVCICAEPYSSMNLNVKNSNLYEHLITIIERLINLNKINKEYLKL